MFKAGDIRWLVHIEWLTATTVLFKYRIDRVPQAYNRVVGITVLGPPKYAGAYREWSVEDAERDLHGTPMAAIQAALEKIDDKIRLHQKEVNALVNLGALLQARLLEESSEVAVN